MNRDQDLLDPYGFGQSMVMGLRVIEAPLRPRYVLPDDVPPPKGMTRDEFAAWSRRVCGVVCNIKPGHALVLYGHTVIAHPADVAGLRCWV